MISFPRKFPLSNTKLYRMLLGSSNSNPAKVGIEWVLGLFQSHHWTNHFWVSSGRVSFLAVLPIGVSSACAIFELSVQLLLESISELLNRLGRGGVVTGMWVTLWRNGPTCL